MNNGNITNKTDPASQAADQITSSALLLLDQVRKLEAMNSAQRKKLTEYQEVIKTKTTTIERLTLMETFMRKRIKQVHGHQGFIDVMAHIDCPGGFDIANYKLANGVQ